MTISEKDNDGHFNLVPPASALDYTIDAPGDPEYGTPTSIEVVHTVDGGEIKNEDVSKNAAMIPPGFGTPSADTRGTGTYLTPNLAPAGAPIPGAVINGSQRLCRDYTGDTDSR